MIWDFTYFTEDEFRCKCGCGRADMDEEFVRRLDLVRGRLDIPFAITSGFRCPEHNTKVSSTGASGPHTTGLAADIGLSRKNARDALSELSEAFSGIGINQKGDGRFIHVDMLGRRIWSY